MYSNDLMLDTGIDLIFFLYVIYVIYYILHIYIYHNDLMHIWLPYTYCTVLDRQMWQPATGHPRKSLTKRPRRPFPCLHPVFQAANGKFNGYPDFMVLNHVSLDVMRFNATQVTQSTCGWSGFVGKILSGTAETTVFSWIFGDVRCQMSFNYTNPLNKMMASQEYDTKIVKLNSFWQSNAASWKIPINGGL
jgi:hypothetical protein